MKDKIYHSERFKTVTWSKPYTEWYIWTKITKMFNKIFSSFNSKKEKTQLTYFYNKCTCSKMHWYSLTKQIFVNSWKDCSRANKRKYLHLEPNVRKVRDRYKKSCKTWFLARHVQHVQHSAAEYLGQDGWLMYKVVFS